MGPKHDPLLDEVKQEAAKSITPGWTPSFAPTLAGWRPKEHAPARPHLVLEVKFRDPSQSPASWTYSKCVTWLESNARKVGLEDLPALPYFAPVQGGAGEDEDGKLRTF